MQWLFWQKPVAQALSNQVKQILIGQFNLDSDTVDKMRFSGKKGRYSNRPVKYIRIYDPVIMEGGESTPPSYDAFALKGGRRSALLFDGHIEKIDNNDRVFLTDRRAA